MIPRCGQVSIGGMLKLPSIALTVQAALSSLEGWVDNEAWFLRYMTWLISQTSSTSPLCLSQYALSQRRQCLEETNPWMSVRLLAAAILQQIWHLIPASHNSSSFMIGTIGLYDLKGLEDQI